MNQADTKPLANVNVFISNATIGDKTRADGTFILNNVKPGKYQLVISIVGFETYSQQITVSDKNIALPEIFVFPKTFLLNEVKIKPADDPLRERNYAWFKEQFLGTSDLSKDCKILNPELLDLSYNDAAYELTASSPDFLEIENGALGYKIMYLLSNFTMVNKDKSPIIFSYQGYALFSEMDGSALQKTTWEKMRQKVYEGSAVHFYRSVLKNRVQEEGFRVLQYAKRPNPDRQPDNIIKNKIELYTGDNHKRDSLSYWTKKAKLPEFFQTLNHDALSRTDLLEVTKQPGIFAFGCGNDDLYITYNKNHRYTANIGLAHVNYAGNTDATLITFNSPVALIDNNGVVTNPASITYSGAWVRNRMEALLPVNYEPTKNEAAPVDSSIIKKIFSGLKAYTAAHPEEKVYLHLDKPAYALGDTIWFKAYTVIGQQRQLSALSGVVYVELVSPKDSVINRKIIRLDDGVAWGDLTLPVSYKPGIYHLRAYTNWMRNAGPQFFYDQKIVLGGYQSVINAQKQAAQSNPDVQFFPEGGDLVADVHSKVGIKAVSANGTGVDISGTIEDNNGNVVAGFATQHMGMGVFVFTPQPNKTYKAKISLPGEAGFSVDLPAALEKGFTLAINNTRTDSLLLKVVANDQLFKEKKNSNFYIIAQAGGNVYYSAIGKLQSPVFTAEIDKSIFPSGIVQFTLFSESGEPLNERVAFFKNADTLNFNLKAIAAGTYYIRQKVKIELAVENNNHQPVNGLFSASVINESRIGADETAESTILNNLLLTSDLKGNIEKPNYYFVHESKQTNDDLDVLMLTQGYRKYEWQQVLGKAESPITYQPEKLPELSGNVKTPSGKPVSKGKIYLMETRLGYMIDTVIDANGHFRFKNIDLPDTAKILLTANKENKSNNVIVNVEPPDYPPVIKQNESVQLPPEIYAALNSARQSHLPHAVQSQAVNKRATLKDGKSVKPDSSVANREQKESTIDVRKLQGYPSLKEALAATTEPKLNAFKAENQSKNSTSIIMDGSPVTAGDLNAYLPEEIKSIDLLKDQAGKDVLVIETKRIAGADTTVLNNVNIIAKKIYRPQVVKHSDNMNGAGQANQVIMGSELQGCISLADCLRGRIAGVIEKNDKFITDRAMNRISMSAPGKRDTAYMVLIVDGTLMAPERIGDINVENIYSIEVLRSASYLTIYGLNAMGGALVITTKKAGDESVANNSSPKGMTTYPFKGFYKARTFYSPKYETAKTNSSAPDLRSTIYWKPDIITGADGKASFEYFNADTKGTYRIVIEGIDADGNLGRQVYRYKVE